MEELFNFGISQEDALTLSKALDIKQNDRLLCIASAGDVPLNLLAIQDLKIEAVDISLNQLNLAKMKFHTVCSLEPIEAAAFLGFIDAKPGERIKLFRKVSELMDSHEKLFWTENITAIEKGPINEARFEKYMSKFNGIGLLVLGKKKLLRLFELETVNAQQEYFDQYLSTSFLKIIFKIAFHPKIYKKRGMAPEGLTHSGGRNIADFFYSRFRDFCSATLARKNYFMQFCFFNKVLFPESLPEYLSEKGIRSIRKNRDNLQFRHLSYEERLSQSRKGEFNKFHLSNIGDWMSREEFAQILYLIGEKAASSSQIMSCYIHCRHSIPERLKNLFVPDYQLGEKLVKTDRYPFYNLVPIKTCFEERER
jgi:S-adenosylmethionine:diacylglycerol 3-amino-3-carboxypropyl transferase